ncbi:MAG: flavin reductase [Pseudobutyrivibrio sp.]|nr:flavin reductase [Pseudobutyrivibrio sp.]
MANRVFQPFPLDMLEWNPSERIGTEGVAIITETPDRQNAMANHNGGIGTLWGVPMFYTFIRNTRYTKELMDQSVKFSACFFDQNEKATKSIMKILNVTSGRTEDKIKELHLNIEHAHDVPYVEEANFIILCEKVATIPINETMINDRAIMERYYSGANSDNFHTLYIGRIIEAMAR